MSHWKSYVGALTSLYLHAIDLCEEDPSGKKYWWAFTTLNASANTTHDMVRCTTHIQKWRPKDQQRLPIVNSKTIRRHKKYSEVKVFQLVQL